MKIVLQTNIVSPHQLPFARSLLTRVGSDSFRYVYQEALHRERARMGWCADTEPWVIPAETEEARKWLESADVVVSGLRDLALFARRCAAGRKTFYSSERWFKPPLGRLRLLVPRYRKMARWFVKLARECPCFRVLPIGVHSQQDFKRLGVPENKMTTWGYFVAPSACLLPRQASGRPTNRALRVLWVGRMLALKRVETLFKAAGACLENLPLELTIVGDGPERARLERLSKACFRSNPNAIHFRHSVPIDEVRLLMRQNDVYVLPSNAYEGWGAVVSEAMEEGMVVLGSNQAGASATMLPASHRFDCWDFRRLAVLLGAVARGELTAVPVGEWSAEKAAERFLRMCE